MDENRNETRPEKRPSRRFRIILYVVLTAALVPVFVVGGWLLHTASREADGIIWTPSDEQMIDDFREHEQEFKELARMLREDPDVDEVVLGWSDPPSEESSAPVARLDRYQRLLRSIGVIDSAYRARVAGGANAVWFDTVNVGGLLDNTIKGYVYSPEQPGKLLESLDSIPSAPGDPDFFRRIEGDWYLYGFTLPEGYVD